MSRATTLALFIIILQASIGFVDATGIFTDSYLDIPENNGSYTITDLNEYYTQTEESSGIDDLEVIAGWAIDSFFIGIKVVFAVVFVWPTLITVFGVPAILATFLQAGVYFVYATWYAQYRSGKGWKQYE